MGTLIELTPLGLVVRWSNRSQQGACRNAQVGCAALAVRRAERLDAERFVVAHLARRAEAAAG